VTNWKDTGDEHFFRNSHSAIRTQAQKSTKKNGGGREKRGRVWVGFLIQLERHANRGDSSMGNTSRHGGGGRGTWS